MKELQPFWNNICKIYFLTKHYLLLSEELSEEFDTFLQPLKEHRDAFDHIARVYGYNMLDKSSIDIDEYRVNNMKKATGHVYRAFFDTADWLSYVCRKKIREMLFAHSKEEIVSKYPNYESAKSILNDLPKQIADIRSRKDLSNDETALITEVEEYSLLLDEILNIYDDIHKLFM